MSWWVLSWRADILGFFLPVFVAVLLVPLSWNVPDNEVPLPYYAPLVVMVDVAHVYGTLFRTVLDSEATQKNRSLFLFSPVCLFLASFLIIAIGGEALGWTLLAYYAIFHFMKQPFGILCLYKARRAERDAFDHRLDYWTCMLGAACPVLLDHLGRRPLDTPMTWFNNGERYLFGLPLYWEKPLWFLYVAMPTIWLGRNAWLRRVSARPLNIGKLWIMAVQYASWYVGVIGRHEIRSLAFVNLFHGVASMVLVYHVVQRRYDAWRKRSPSTMAWQDKWCEKLVSSPWPYLAVMVVLATFEELNWEVWIYHAYLPEFGVEPPQLRKQWQRALVVSGLMQPQLVHYFLDGFIWKLAARNPGLKEAYMWSHAGSAKR